MNTDMIDKLVEMRGIESHYTDAWGKGTDIQQQTKLNLLKAMGYSVDDADLLQQQVDQQLRRAWLSPLNPVQVVQQQQALLIPVRLPIELVNDTFHFVLKNEAGKVSEHPFIATQGELINNAHIDDVEIQEYLISLDVALETGYYQLQLKAEDDALGQMRVIVTPKTCYQPQAIQSGHKLWGLSVQLYCLRSQHNWGIGDFSDLASLVEQAAQRGADFIGLNPIHALYPANPDMCSPYGPSSRRWLNFIYLDVSALEGYSSEPVQALVNSDAFQSKLARLRAAEYVDYAGVTELKLRALERIFEYQYQKYLSKNSKVNKVFKAFVARGGESLQMLAVYDALQADLASQGKASWGWPVFPQSLDEFHKPAVGKFAKSNAKKVKFYLFLQWQAALQLENTNRLAKERGMHIGLYRDLAVGVSEGSAEIWGNKDLYCADASVGAPPDVLGPLGQNWGLPPMDPDKLYQQAYQPIIDLFDANMQSAGALRIDHVMALLRLWWVYQGDDAKQGGYVYYPVDDLLGILALESQRHQSLVIGEDLGTVPDEIRLKLANFGVYSYRVFFFEQADDGGFYSPTHYPVQSMSSLTTHDMPTLKGYWHCLDLELGNQLGLYPNDGVLQDLYHSRHLDKQQILDSLHGHASVPASVGRDVNFVSMHKPLNFGLQTHMAAGASALLSLQLEDWLEMDKPVNIPGTYKEYPNWQRKLDRDLQDIFSDPDIVQLTDALTQSRKGAGE